jgi:hypothetical protein
MGGGTTQELRTICNAEREADKAGSDPAGATGTSKPIRVSSLMYRSEIIRRCEIFSPRLLQLAQPDHRLGIAQALLIPWRFHPTQPK